ncbi:hypothetical protein RFI_20345 [Reticulomyxa filosa]|uniref:PDZ domain-containing protein n=1 Tax=Reticulomyxa filosa TaxID=46433 RepID=X6MSP7_RETFI|nr:hypothetical protein RFI_20345 [Reticulomyxa filosa]|eukprot:ETO16988.1 hypothetical protein RFI_20345 [Reticulomyxa filosa]
MSEKLAARYSGLIMELDPKKMLPGASAPVMQPQSDSKAEEKKESNIDNGTVMQRAAIEGGRRKTKHKKKNFDELVPENEEGEEKDEKKQTDEEVQWEGVGEGGGVLAPLNKSSKAMLSVNEAHIAAIPEVSGKPHIQHRAVASLEEDNEESSEEDDAIKIPVIPALEDSKNNPNNSKMQSVHKIVVHNQNNTRSIEKKYRFDTKPMGFTIWTDEEKEEIVVDTVRDSSVASAFGVCPNWMLVEVNGKRDILDMFELLEDTNGPFDIVFKVYVDDVASRDVNVLSAQREITPKKVSSFNDANLKPSHNRIHSLKPMSSSMIESVNDESLKAEILRLQKALEQLTLRMKN